jgi:hypothetical protein
VAYQSNTSGRSEIYVRSFPDPTRGPWLVSNVGGVKPLWSRNGLELFYLGLSGSMMLAPIDARVGEWHHGTPTKLLEDRYFDASPTRSYDLSADGRRFLMIKEEGGNTPPSITVIFNWREELKRLVPVN